MNVFSRGMLMFGKDVRMKKTIEKRQGTVKSLHRVERIIKLIAFLQTERTYKDISEYLGVSYKSANRYINSLVQLGFEVQRIYDKHHAFKILNTATFLNIK
jgi:predicted transcriptional regulator